MGFLDALFGHKDEPQNDGRAPQNAPYPTQSAVNRPQNADEQALARYRYMLQTAPPEELEKAHQEAFARLTPEQRKLALQQMSQMVPEAEAHGLSDDPRNLARAATRAELRQPGAMERMFGGANQVGGMGMGGGMMGGMGGGMMGGGMGFGGSLLTSLAGGFIGSSIANSFFNNSGHEQAFQSSPEAQAVDGGVSDYSPSDYNPDFEPTGFDSSADPYGDPGAVGNAGYDNASYDNSATDSSGFGEGAIESGGLDSSADAYGDPGLDSSFDSGGDFGGSDFGGGDF